MLQLAWPRPDCHPNFPMEFLDRHRAIRRPGGIEILLNKRVAHDDLVALLAEPRRLWEREGITVDHDGKNRLGHGCLGLGFAETEVFLKEFGRKSSVDTLLSLGRPSRAAKSFHAGLEMRRRDLPTPEPLAAITARRAGWVRGDWLITDWLPGTTTLREVLDHPDRHRAVLDIWPWELLLEDVGRLLRRMSDARVLHRDLSLRNILVETPGETPPERPRLWIIDLNRVLTLEARQWSIGLAARNAQRFRLSAEEFDHVLRGHFPDPAERESHRATFEAAWRCHRRYKDLKKLPRRRA